MSEDSRGRSVQEEGLAHWLPCSLPSDVVSQRLVSFNYLKHQPTPLIYFSPHWTNFWPLLYF